MTVTSEEPGDAQEEQEAELDVNSVVDMFAQGADILQGKSSLKEARNISDEAIANMYAVTHDLYNSGKYEQALKAFELLCIYDHENPDYWKGLGYCRQVMHDYMGAATALSYSTVFADTEDWELNLNIAQCLIASGDKDTAQQYIEAVLAAEDAGEALKNRAQVLQN